MSQIEFAPLKLQNELLQSMRHYSLTPFLENGRDSLLQCQAKSNILDWIFLINAPKINLAKHEALFIDIIFWTWHIFLRKVSSTS